MQNIVIELPACVKYAIGYTNYLPMQCIHIIKIDGYRID